MTGTTATRVRHFRSRLKGIKAGLVIIRKPSLPIRSTETARTVNTVKKKGSVSAALPSDVHRKSRPKYKNRWPNRMQRNETKSKAKLEKASATRGWGLFAHAFNDQVKRSFPYNRW